MILENFRKKSSDLELVWGRKTSYKVDPQIKKKNHRHRSIALRRTRKRKEWNLNERDRSRKEWTCCSAAVCSVRKLLGHEDNRRKCSALDAERAGAHSPNKGHLGKKFDFGSGWSRAWTSPAHAGSKEKIIKKNIYLDSLLWDLCHFLERGVFE